VVKMDLAELKRLGKIRKIPIDKKQINNLIKLSKRDLDFAEEVKDKNPDWVFSIAYSSILQMSRALLYSYGYDTDELELHKTTLDFVAIILGEKYGEIVNTFDRLRRKRNATIYDEAGIISEYEAKFAIKTAKDFYEVGRKKVEEKLRSA